MENKKPKYKKVLLKISGEVLMGEEKFGISLKTLKRIAKEICEIHKMGVEVAILTGGGNFIRGVQASFNGIDRVNADMMGMIATVINAIALQDALEKMGVHTRVLSAIEMHEVAEPYIRRRAIRHLEKGRVVIFGCGTGSPYFTTDTGAALRAAEINAEIILKGTKVDGVYDSDPAKNSKAKMFEKISYMEVLKSQLRVMDLTSITMCKENKIPVLVFNLNKYGNIIKAILGENVGTIIS